jgi:hypothetical protein
MHLMHRKVLGKGRLPGARSSEARRRAAAAQHNAAAPRRARRFGPRLLPCHWHGDRHERFHASLVQL